MYYTPTAGRRERLMEPTVPRRRALHHLIAVVLAATGPALVSTTLIGQIAKERPPDIAAELEKVPKPPPSNQVVGIDVNRFIGNPLSSPVHVTQDVIFTRS